MTRVAIRLAALSFVCLALAADALGQGPSRGPSRRGGFGGPPDGGPQDKQPEYVPPADPRLANLHKVFVENAAKLAGEYEKSNQLDKARDCYAEILRLVPGSPAAKEALERIDGKQSVADKKVANIMANDQWQHTGVVVAQGKPVVIKADGTWNFVMRYDITADGIEIPKELRDFNLGSLIGMIDDGNSKEARPFFIGSEKKFVAEKTGELLLRMYDADPTDNSGKLTVYISGTFANGTKK